MKHFQIFKANVPVTSMEGAVVNLGADVLEGIAKRYDPKLHEAPLIVGHPQHDAPAYGWVTVTGAIQLRREKTCADLAQNAANYAASNKVTLAGASQFTHADSDPITVIETGKDAIRSKIGKRPNTMVIGAKALLPLKFHAKLIDKIKYVQKGMIRLEQLRDLFEIENIVVGEAVYAGDNDAFGDIWSDNIILAYVPKRQSGVERNVMEAAYGYTPRRRGSLQVDVRTEDGKIELVRATDNYRPYIVGAEAGYLIADTNV